MKITYFDTGIIKNGIRLGEPLGLSIHEYEILIPKNNDGYTVYGVILFNDVVMEITVFDEKVIGFKIPFLTTDSLIFTHKDREITIGETLKIEDLLHFLNSNNISWEIFQPETLEHRISIKVNGNLVFFFILDRELTALISIDSNIGW